MLLLTKFDYYQLDEPTRALVEDNTERIKNSMRRCLEDYLQVGRCLAEVKQLLEHGQWLDWLDKEFGESDRTAEKLMRTAEIFKFEDCSNLGLGISVLHLLSARGTPQDAREKALALAADGQTVTYERAKSIVASFKNGASTEDRQPYATDGTGTIIEDSVSVVEEMSPIPESIQRLVDDGILGDAVAHQISVNYEKAGPKTKAVIDRDGISDPALVPELDRLEKTGSQTFKDILASGSIPGVEESVPINRATIRDLDHHLEYASRQHVMVSVQEKKERDEAAIREQLEGLSGGSTPVIITDNLGELDRAPDNCIALFSPGNESLNQLASSLQNRGFQHLTLLLYKGDPVVNLDGKTILASHASRRTPVIAARILKEYCDLSDIEDTED